jgi:hypothetical protein
MGTTPRYHLTTMGPGDTFSADSYKYTDGDRRLLELLGYLGAEGHHHTGAAGVVNSPVAPAVSLDATEGTLPGGTRIYYKVTLVDPDGLESDGSVESYIDTPAALAPPAAPSLLVLPTGGTLQPGTRYYALSAYFPLSTQETTAPSPTPVTISSGSTNSVKVTRPTLPVGATGWNVYRRNPGEVDYFYVTSLLAAATEWIDDGSVASACDRRRPQTNQTNATNSVLVSLGGATPGLPAAGWTWKIYRTLTNASYVNSYLHHVVEETEEASGITAISHIDTGGAAMAGQPPAAAPVIGSPTKVLLTGGAEVQGVLPYANVAGVPVVVTFQFSGPVVAQDGTGVWTCEFPVFTILGVRATLGRNSVPAAQAVIADVKKWTGDLATPQWTSLFTSMPARPQVAVGTMQGTRKVPQTTGLVLGDMIVGDILQAGGGATPTDADLIITVYGIAGGFA